MRRFVPKNRMPSPSPLGGGDPGVEQGDVMPGQLGTGRLGSGQVQPVDHDVIAGHGQAPDGGAAVADYRQGLAQGAAPVDGQSGGGDAATHTDQLASAG
jgi:hypothetical protein